MEQTIQIDFHDDKITVLVENGTPFIAIRPIAEAFGLVWSSQLRAIKNDEVLGTCVSHKNTQVGSQKRRMVFLPLNLFHGWLFTINPAKCRADRREKIIAYKRECYDVLNDYFQHGGAINPEASESQLIGLQSRIEYYQQFMPEAGQGTESRVSGRDRVLLVRSYFRAHPRKPSELGGARQPDLWPVGGEGGVI
ncbi:MAG: phage antirepressor N-terminal domain-containing protein [Victivallaceae bacterium]